jgi:homoserine O-acetyltransferase
MTLNKIIVAIIICSYVATAFGQSKLQIQNIGNFITTSNDTIKDCKIGYRTLGNLNNDKSNVVFMPTWHLGTSNSNLEYLTSIVDTTNLYIIVIDALGNGVSSSPSNYLNFPNISIRDMVNSQHKLLVNHLKIEHVKLLVGVSMGGMQAFEWMVAYPEYMTQLIAINGTTKSSFYDKASWNTIVTLIEDAVNSQTSMEYAMKRVADIELLLSTSPSYVSRKYEKENFEEFKAKSYTRNRTPYNQLVQSKAMLEHNIYKDSNASPENVLESVKAEVLIIIAEQDHLVNPIYSKELSKVLYCDILELKGDCGHFAAFCDTELVKQAISEFLKN